MQRRLKARALAAALLAAGLGSGLVAVAASPSAAAGTTFAAPVSIYTSGSIASGVAVDAHGNVFVGTANNLYELTPKTGGGYNTPAAILPTTSYPSGVDALAVDAKDNVFLADSSGIQEVVSTGNATWGTTPVTLSDFGNINTVGQAYGVAVDASGDVFGAFSGGYVLELKPSSTGSYTTGETLVTVASVSFLQTPAQSVAVDGKGDVFFSEPANLFYEATPKTGGGYNTPAPLFSLNGSESKVLGLAVDASGDVFASQNSVGGIYELVPSSTGGYTNGTLVKLPPLSSTQWAGQLAVDASGDVFATYGGFPGGVYELPAVSDGDLSLARPSNITVSPASSSGTTVTYTPPRASDEGGAVTAACLPASGSTFLIGTTTVNCSATSADDTPSTVSTSFTVTVLDTDLSISTPSNVTATATSSSGAVVTYTTPTVTDESRTAGGGVEALPSVSCSPASGSTFPVGVTTVTCTGTSSLVPDEPAVIKTFTVTVTDADLSLTQPANVTTDATSPSGAAVNYAPSASDEGAAVPASCTPLSGSTFPIGKTTVHCSATSTDDANSPVDQSFTVTVLGVPAQLARLASAVQDVGPGKSLPAKVAAITHHDAAGDLTAACGTLAAFSSEVTAQSGYSILPATATTLIAAATRIADVMGC